MDDKPVTRKELLDALSDFATKAETLQAVADARAETLQAVADARAETLQAVADAKTEILERVAGIVQASQSAVLEKVAEMVRDAQTELLRAFLGYQENTDLRIRTVEAKVSNVDAGLSQRVNHVERRLWEIEKKLLLNPPAA
jgi:myo-inositol-1-phosphate synthase